MKGLSASTFRYILFAILTLLIVAAIAIFYFTQQQLRGYAETISAINSEIAQNDTNIATLRRIEAYLAEHRDEQTRAAEIVADSKNYQYQDQIIRDINRFGNQSNITILGYNFSDNESSAQQGAQTPPANSAPQGNASTPSADAGGAATGGTAPAQTSLNSKSVTVSIESPVGYRNLLSFINRIEQNTTKMQISSVSMSAATEEGASSNSVTADSFLIKVYVR